MGARFVPPEQLEDIVATLQRWGYSDTNLAALLGGNLLRLSRQVWKAPAHG
jgi:membrane dipeptidase